MPQRIAVKILKVNKRGIILSANKNVYYKGFDADLKCRGHQFEVGETYKHNDEVKACFSGFHSCSDPWDVLNYYDITSRFAYVEIGGQTATHDGDSKIASGELTVKVELTLSEFITDCINFMEDICKSDISHNNSQLAASGYSSRLVASGDSSIAIIAGLNGRVKGGDNSALALTYWVESEKRYRITVAYVGENGIKANTWYKLGKNGNFVEAE